MPQWPPINETAVLTVNGSEFSDWESVAVQREYMSSLSYSFQFICSEDSPIPTDWWAMRIRPGDTCTIKLAGILVFTGFVSTRQAYYDARRHYVELQGASPVIMMTGTSIVTKTGEFKNLTIEQFIRKVAAAYNIPIQIKGTLPDYKFDRIATPHGISSADLMDLKARVIGDIKFGSNPQGELVIYGLNFKGGSYDLLEEGKNILWAREIIYNPSFSGQFPNAPVPPKNATVSQAPGNDQVYGPKVTHMPFFEQTMAAIRASPNYTGMGSFPEDAKVGPLVVPLETPAKYNDSFLSGRSNAERDWLAQDQITVFVNVYGWVRPNGGLWEEGQMVSVESPSLLLNAGIPLTVKKAVFTQNSQRGSTTTLELCNQAALSKFIPSAPTAPRQ